jgi:GTP-binding protein EngB required for normal cell division
MNDDQKRHLAATFRRIDELLAAAETNLAPADAARLFPPCAADAAPVQRKVIADYARRARALMAAALDRFGASAPAPELSGVWAARTNLMQAQLAAAELAPEHMGRHGPLAANSERSLRAMVDETWELLDRMESYLAQGPGTTLDARLERTGISGEHKALLKELERIVSAHGLLQFRTSLESLAERLESGELEVAVFGRVNSGKSSLLNHLLQTSALPVGVTPVTAIPVRIVHGRSAWGRVSFVDAAPEIFDLGRMAEFVSKQQNLSNARHVTRLTVEIPSPLLHPGIAFVDTPQIESLDAGRTAETTAYLPRCDLGLVLVDASSTLTDTEVELVDALRHAGAEVMVLLSKADLLEGQDLQCSVSTIQQELSARLHVEIPVYPVSVKGAAALCDRWLDTVLMPHLRDHRVLSTQALGRKLGILRDAVRSALDKRLSAAAGAADALKHERLREIDRILDLALARLDAARHERPPELDQLGGLAHQALDEAAHNAAVIWNQSHNASNDITSFVEASVQSRAGVAAAALERRLADLRTLVRATLAEAHSKYFAATGLYWEPGEDLPRTAGAPILDGASVVPRTVLQRPALAFAGIGMLKRGILGQMEVAELEQRIAGALQAYGRRLEAWRESMLNDLRSGFIARRKWATSHGTPDNSDTPDAKTDTVETILADLHQIDKLCRSNSGDLAS